MAMPTDGLLAYYSGNTINGSTIPDDSGNGNDLSVSHPVYTVPGYLGDALKLDGAFAAITGSIAGSAVGELSVSMWAEHITRTSALNSGLWRQQNSGSGDARKGTAEIFAGHVYSAQGAATATASSAWPANTPAHFCFVTRATEIELWIDGVLAASQSATPPASPSTNWAFGAWSGQVRLLGWIQAIRVYSRALTPAEIATLSSEAPPHPDQIQDTTEPAAASLSGGVETSPTGTIAETTAAAAAALAGDVLGAYGPLGATLADAIAALRWAAAPAGVVYRCTLTGAPDSLPDLRLPMSSFSARLRSGAESTLSVTIPSIDAYGSAIAARPGGEIVIDHVRRYVDGTEIKTELCRMNQDSIRTDRGALNQTITLTGSKQTTNSSPKSVTIPAASYRGEYGGGRRFRCQVAPELLAADTAIIAGESLTVGHVVVSGNVSGVLMEVIE